MSKTTSTAFSADEKAAMKEGAREGRARKSATAATDLQDVLDKIAEMKEPDRALAQRVHAIVTASAPSLAPKTWYGMPAYARDGKNVCFFQPAAKFKTRYSTFGFNDAARLDDGEMWPVAYALRELTPADEARLAELVRRAVG